MGTRRQSALQIATLAIIWLSQLPAPFAYNGRASESERWFWDRLGQLEAAASPIAAASEPQPSAIARRLEDFNSAVPLLRTEASESLIESLLSRHRQRTRVMLARRPLYFPLIEKLVAEQELPAELKCLPMAASALNPAGRFSGGRAGLWGFTEPTARLYGLRIDARLDERLDPQRSTEAAIQRLQDLYEVFGDWRLAIAAHGAGPAAVQRAIEKEGGSRQFDKLEPHLPIESLALLDAFTAAVYLDRFYELEGLKPAPPVTQASLPVNPMAKDESPVTGSDAGATAATIEDALQWKESYSLTVYQVRPGDSLGRISRRYGVSISDLRRWNGLRSDLIFPGQQLEIRAPDRRIRQAKSTPPSKPKAVPPPDTRGLELHYHQVSSGETLSGIADRYQVRLSDLRRWNGISGDLIYAGQRLKVYSPARQQAASVAAKPEPLPDNAPQQYYIIRSGDTLWSIARRFPGVSAEDLKRLNNVHDARSLRPGMRILIPSGD